MGVCCIVFDIDGMLFEFFMNFYIFKKIKFEFYFFQNFMFSKGFMLFPTFKKKNWCKKKNSGGGGSQNFGGGGGVLKKKNLEE